MTGFEKMLVDRAVRGSVIGIWIPKEKVVKELATCAREGVTVQRNGVSASVRAEVVRGMVVKTGEEGVLRGWRTRGPTFYQSLATSVGSPVRTD